MRSLYRRLAFSSIQRHKNVFLPFIGTIVFLMTLNAICLSIMMDRTLASESGMETMVTIMGMAVGILSIFSVIMLSSVYSFIQKQKNKESGLYLILGLEKKHLRLILFWEMVYVMIFSIVPGSVFSLILYKLSLGLFVRMTNLSIDIFAAGFFSNVFPIFYISAIFVGVLLLVLFLQFFSMRKYSPIGLIQESKAGEKTNRFAPLIGLVGVVCLIAGYAISILTKQPLEALSHFFLAALLVIIGTYCSFSVLVALVLQGMKNKKSMYYKKENFFAISGLLYRVKNNSRSLANIAILSTALTIVLTSGISLYSGANDLLNRLFPVRYSVEVYDTPSHKETLTYYQNLLGDYVKEKNLQGEVKATVSWSVPFLYEKEKLHPLEQDKATGNIWADNRLIGLDLYYAPNSKVDFGENDILLVEKQKEKAKVFETLGYKVGIISPEKNDVPMEEITVGFDRNKSLIKNYSIGEAIASRYQPNIDAWGKITPSVKISLDGENFPDDFAYNLRNYLEKTDSHVVKVTDREASKVEFRMMYGVIFFTGIILSVAFMVSMSLAIYYKQLTEGYEDVERFRIMQQLGMTKEEGKQTIQKQIRTLLFLPVIFCIVHTCFAFPIVQKFLSLIGLLNTKLFIVTMIGVFVVYILYYFIVYRWTEKVYRKIVLKS
ncbi:FtsX-like permease family protein [Peptoniphilus sp. KCTC 25270]|uniref:FtsX-like permease family protein n=1 Tax=Peptoniphilus sp. KCTC 25270 TaxID=2897414 RepID=UPI001E303D63|nr:FtsX-like permease family protein [Peptoniphilus sp. KCTC 25270]MCD1147314.1 FtsX-like permease family protein [Peptoniphilus sp. KCTC 25270]